MPRGARTKILFVPFYYHIQSAVQNELELMQRHLDAGDRCSVLLYRHRIATMTSSYRHWGQHADAVDRLRRGMRLLEPALVPREVPLWPRCLLPDAFTQALAAGDLAGVQACRWQNFEYGYAALASLITTLVEPRPDVALHASFLALRAGVAIALYEDLRERLRRERPDRVYTFNGRHPLPRAVLRACEAEGVDYAIHERGCDLDHYALFENALPHDFEFARRWIEATWTAADPAARVERARRFFADHRAPTPSTPYSYTLAQQRGRLPAGWDATRRNVVFYVSSDDEYEAIGPEWSSALYASQGDALREIAQSLAAAGPEHVLWVRTHPHLKGVVNSQVRAMRELHQAGLIRHLEADDPVDSYALIDAAAKVVAFRSTVGVEASYWKRPALRLAPALYQGLDATYEPASHAEVMALLLDPDLPPKPELGALRYGYFRAVFGERYRYAGDPSRRRARFKGRKLEASGRHQRATRYFETRVLPLLDRGASPALRT
jgi:hypothetical protein